MSRIDEAGNGLSPEHVRRASGFGQMSGGSADCACRSDAMCRPCFTASANGKAREEAARELVLGLGRSVNAGLGQMAYSGPKGVAMVRPFTREEVLLSLRAIQASGGSIEGAIAAFERME